MASNVTYVGDSTFADTHLPTPGKTLWGMDTLVRHVSGGAPNLIAYLNSLAQSQIYYYLTAGSGTTQTSGSLVVGNKYTITTFVAGDNFTNVGGTDTTGSVFIATGPTPTTWTNGSTLTLNAAAYYLQIWEDDKNPVFPTVTLQYKGLVAGIPDPFVSGESTDKTMTKSATNISITFWDYTLQQSVTKSVNATLNMQYRARRTTWKWIYFSTTTQSGTSLSYVPPTNPKYTTLDISNPDTVNIYSIITADGNNNFGSGVPLALATALATTPYLEAVSSAQPVWGSPYIEVTDVVDQLLE